MTNTNFRVHSTNENKELSDCLVLLTDEHIKYNTT